MSRGPSSLAPRLSTRATRAKLSARDVAALAELRRLLSLEPGISSFSVLHPMADNPLPKSEAEVDAFIARRTKLWRESWILPVLDEMIARGKKDKR